LRRPRRSLTTGPPNLATWVHPRMKSYPPRVPRCPPAVRRVRRTSSLWFSAPSTTSLRQAPYGWAVQHPTGSARGLSQPLSGFLANPSFAALFHAATVPGVPPSESSPHRNRAPLSRPLTPLRSSTNVPTRRLSHLIAAGFLDSHAFTRLPDSPDDYELPFHPPRRTCFPVTLGPSDEA